MTYSYWVSATESALSNSTSATVTDFTLPASAAVTVLAGGSATTKVTVGPLGGFSGAVSFSGGVSGISVLGTASSPASPATLRVSAISTTVPDTYNLTVIGTAGDATGSVSHTLQLTVVVTPPPVVSIPPGSTWQPNPAIVGQTITSTVNTSVSNPYQAPNGDTVTQTWTWATGNVYMSATGAPGSFSAASNYSISWSQGSASTVFSGSFINPGYYIVGVTATLTYYDNTTGQSFGPYSGSGYIGGSASDLAASGSAASPFLMAPGSQAAQPQATGTMTVDGIAVLPLAISITGTNNPAAADYRVLTGQHITATLNGVPSGYTVSGYTWNQPSATCFKTYNEKAPSNQLVPLDSADLTGPASGSTTVAPLAFYDRVQEDLTVTCTVALLAPDGKTTLNITATSPTINVLKPSVKEWDIHTGFVQRVHDTQTDQSGYGLVFAAGSTLSGGEAWSNVTIVLPAPFTAIGGSGCFAQLVTPDIEVSNVDPTKVLPVPNNKKQGLDTSFPYKGYQWDVSGSGANFDGPAVGFMNYNVTVGSGYTQVLTNQNYTTWVMYQPPGGVWVPLQSYDWNWAFTSKWYGTQNLWTLWRASPSSTSGDPGYAGADAPSPPQWKLVQTGN